MKIKQKLVIGFAVLISLTGVLVVFSFVQLNNINVEYVDLAENDSVAMELMKEMKYDLDYVIREMYEYLNGDVSHQREEIAEHSKEFDDIVTELDELVPEYATELDELAEDHDAIVDLILDDAEGVLFHEDEIKAHIDEIFALHEEIDADLDALVTMMDDPTMKLNATIMQADLAEQMLFVYEYIANKDAETLSEFNLSLNEFDAAATVISTFYAANASILGNLSLIQEHHDWFSEAVIGNATEEGIFAMHDQIDSNISQIDALHNELVEDLGVIDLEIEEHIAQNKENALNMMTTGLIMIVAIIVVAIVVGVAIAVPIVRGITRKLDDLVRTSDRIAKGDLTVKIKAHSKSNDEITT